MYCVSKIGETYGDLTVINGTEKERVVVVKCNVCGREFEKNYQHLTKGSAVSHEYCSKHINDWENIRHSKFYSSWANMRTRTTNKNSPKFKTYGARGIKSDQFKYFVDFYDLMYESYLEHVKVYGEDDTTIERIDVDKDYCVENCKWETWDNQAKNKTNTHKFIAISPEGKEYYVDYLVGFCKEYDITYANVLASFSRNKRNGNSNRDIKLRNKWIFKPV